MKKNNIINLNEPSALGNAPQAKGVPPDIGASNHAVDGPPNGGDELPPGNEQRRELLASYDGDCFELYRVNGGRLGDAEGYYEVSNFNSDSFITYDPNLAAAMFGLVSLEYFLADYIENNSGFLRSHPDFTAENLNRPSMTDSDLSELAKKIRELIDDEYKERPPFWS